MRILFLEQFSEPGGGQRCMLDLLPEVRARGWSALVAAPGDGTLFEMARREGAETARIEMGPYSSSRKTPSDLLRYTRDTLQLSSWIAAQTADAIYVSGPRPLVAAARGARGRAVVFHVQSLLVKKYAARLTRWAIRQSRATVIADSRYIAGPIEKAAASQLHVVFNGVPEIPFREREFGHGGEWRIGIIGRIAPEKGQTDFLRAAELVLRELPGARFVICGAPLFSPPEYLEEVKRLAATLPCEMLGWRDDVGEVLAELDLLVVPSDYLEATTRVVMEAYSAGVPVVAYANGGIPEVIDDGVTGFLVREFTPEGLAKKIVEVTALDLSKVARAGRAAWEQTYNVARYRKEMLDIIARACDARTAT
ncbi:MAG TPA: glycosyltransferase family 4 protein [Bryobacteraceae bacterium]|nr:glycosyltransferase family 4 protein [Bryobacteraceae bacterium]